MANKRPIVTLTTDFGVSDHYVAAMKAAILRHCPDAVLVDIAHQIPRYDILAGSIALERAVEAFDPGTIHLAVVDPGVGTDRRLLVAQIKGQLALCPGNGLITWAWRRLAPRAVRELTWRPKICTETFHGRDILAPAAGKLASGEPVESLSQPLSDPFLLDVAPATKLAEAEVIHIDHFGNATTNLGRELLKDHPDAVVRLGDLKIGKIHRTYADVGIGQPLALIGSSGLLEIAVRGGSAAHALAIQVGDKVDVS